MKNSPIICESSCMNILVRRSRLSGVERAGLPVFKSRHKYYAAKGSLLEKAYDRLICLGKPAVGTGLACMPRKSYAGEVQVKSTVE